MVRPGRVVTVTLGLIGLGAVGGAVCGAAITVGIGLLTRHLGSVISPGFAQVVGIGAGFGAAVGSVAGPAFAWGLLRRVPLGKAVLWTGVGTVLGALVGELIAPMNFGPGIPGLVIGAVGGLISASVVLRLRVGRGKGRAALSDAPNVRERDKP